VKKYFLYISIISSIFSQDQKFPVAILDFEGQDVKSKVLNACFQRFETSLIESGRFTVIEKNDRDEVLEEQKVQSSGICDTDCIVDVGQMLGADYLVMGEIISLSGLYQINIKVISVESGSVTEKVTEEVEGNEIDLLNAMDRASDKIIRKLSIQRPIYSQIAINKNPKTIIQKYGIINIVSEPIGALVLVDDEKIGTTPIKNKKIKIGTKNLKIIKTGYNTINKGIRISEIDTVNLDEIMSFMTGSLEISSEPEGAEIYINDEFRGLSPIKIEGFVIGRHEIMASYPDYHEGLEEVIIEYDKTTKSMINLTPMYGSINISLNINDVEIYINDKIYVSDTSGFTTINKLYPNDYDINFSKVGYESVAKKWKVLPNKTETLEIYMYLKKVANQPSIKSTLSTFEASILNQYNRPKYLKKYPSKRSSWIHITSGRVLNDHVIIDIDKVAVKELPNPASKTKGAVLKDKKFKIVSFYNNYVEIEIPKNFLKKWVSKYETASYVKSWEKNESEMKNKFMKTSKNSPLTGIMLLVFLYIIAENI
jgi:hypothetical protein